MHHEPDGYGGIDLFTFSPYVSHHPIIWDFAHSSGGSAGSAGSAAGASGFGGVGASAQNLFGGLGGLHDPAALLKPFLNQFPTGSGGQGGAETQGGGGLGGQSFPFSSAESNYHGIYYIHIHI